MTNLNGFNRRTVMKGIGATSVGGIAGCIGEPDEVRETFELDGISGGWNGISPAEIADVTNPTLELEAGETYRVLWTNGDSAPHNFVILDDDGDRIVGTDIFSNEGATHELEFEATEEMVEYHCSVHRNTMRSNIDIEGVDQ